MAPIERNEDCPFCGAQGEIHELDDGVFAVQCESCCAIGPMASTPYGAVVNWEQRGVHCRCGSECSIEEIGLGSHPVFAVICQTCGIVGQPGSTVAEALALFGHRDPRNH